MSFTLNENLVFIDSMLCLNSSLDIFVKNLCDKDFKYLSEVFSDEELNWLNRKVFILKSILAGLKDLKKVNYLILIVFSVH